MVAAISIRGGPGDGHQDIFTSRQTPAYYEEFIGLGGAASLTKAMAQPVASDN